MAAFNLEALSLKELKQLQKDLAKAISNFEDRRKAEARAKLGALAKRMGYSLADLVGVEVKGISTLAAPKYRHREIASPPRPDAGVARSAMWGTTLRSSLHFLASATRQFGGGNFSGRRLKLKQPRCS